MNIQAELQEALDRLKNAQTPQDIQKAVAIAEIVRLLAQEQKNVATAG